MKSKIYKIYKNSDIITEEIYIRRSELRKRGNNSTFNVKKVLKVRELDLSNSLVNVVFSCGFANSLKEAKHIILDGNMLLNSKIVSIVDVKLKSGDIVTSTSSKTLLNYYNRRWRILKFNVREDYIKYKYLISDKRVHRISFNSILWL